MLLEMATRLQRSAEASWARGCLLGLAAASLVHLPGPAVLAPLAQGGELAPSKKLMAAAKLSRGSSLLRWRRRGNLRQEPEVDDGVVWHIRVAPGTWRAVITELVAQGKDVACDFFFERK